MAKKKWRQVPKDWLPDLSPNPNKPGRLRPERLHCPCGSTLFFVIKEKRQFKRHKRGANLKRHRIVCASCWDNTEIIEA